MAFASITYTSASGTTFALTNSDGNAIEYLRQSDITVTVNGTEQTLTTDYTFNAAGTSIVLNSAVSNATVAISRITSIVDATVNFTAGSTLTAQDLNNSDRQNRFALQEFSDLYEGLQSGTGDLGALGGFIDAGETWVSDDGHAATTNAIDNRIDSKVDAALTGDIVAGNALTISDNSPASGQITIAVTDGAIDTAELTDNAVTTAKITGSAVTTAKIADSNVTTAKIADSNVTTAKINDAAVTTAKVADSAVTTAKIADANVTTAKIADSNVTTAKINDSAVTNAKINDAAVNTAKLADSAVTSAKIADGTIATGDIADSAVTNAKIADGTITSAKLTGGTVVVESEVSGVTTNDTSFFTTAASDSRYFRQDSTETIDSGDTWSGSDSFIATTGAIDARIIDLVDDVGGFVPIANETSFPAANPDVNDGAGTIVSIKEIATTRTPSSGTVTIANGSGSNTVTINGCGTTELAAGYGCLVETTTTLHTYNFHRLTPKATEITTVASDSADIGTVADDITNVNTVAGSIANVNTVAGSIANVNTVATNIDDVTGAAGILDNFLDLYLGSQTSDPSTDTSGNAITTGDLYFNSNSSQLRVYNGTIWQSIAENSLAGVFFADATFSAVYTAAAGSNTIDLGSVETTGAVFPGETAPTNRMDLALGSTTFDLGSV
jgi:hypothetical protein